MSSLKIHSCLLITVFHDRVTFFYSCQQMYDVFGNDVISLASDTIGRDLAKSIRHYLSCDVTSDALIVVAKDALHTTKHGQYFLHDRFEGRFECAVEIAAIVSKNSLKKHVSDGEVLVILLQNSGCLQYEIYNYV